jgi:hypothetical protein
VDALLVLLLVIGLLLPIGVAAVTVIAGLPKGGAANRGMAVAFGKGIGLGVLIGVLASAATVGAVLGVACLSGK